MAVLMIDIESGINIAKMEMRKNGPNTHRKRRTVEEKSIYYQTIKKRT
jgi:hypothetical protein